MRRRSTRLPLLRPAELTTGQRALYDACGAPPGLLSDTAVARLGRPGFDAVVFIVIHYLALGTLLNAYDVPAGRAVAWLP
ncbi:hypothetical protein [Actinoallomurus sp. NPDC050550]|uniref:hypothetical protein n=1 Tax=Actinoallomurus sp. NPDC050550 TaxID=3154937 RepID=UPI0033F445C2